MTLTPAESTRTLNRLGYHKIERLRMFPFDPDMTAPDLRGFAECRHDPASARCSPASQFEEPPSSG